MRLICSKCGHAIDPKSVNVQADLAKCDNCDEILRASRLLEDIDLETGFQPPKGSKIVFSRQATGDGSILIPRRCISASDVFPIGFAIVWLGFWAFWTIGLAASGAPISFLLFSIPFWLVGLGMAAAITNSLLERQIVELTTDELRIHKVRPLFPRHHAIPYADIHGVSIDQVSPTNPGTVMLHTSSAKWTGYGFVQVAMPTVTHGVKKTRFAESVSEPEMKWLVGFLKAVVHRKTGRRL